MYNLKIQYIYILLLNNLNLDMNNVEVMIKGA